MHLILDIPQSFISENVSYSWFICLNEMKPLVISHIFLFIGFKDTSVLTFWLSDYADGLRITNYNDENVWYKQLTLKNLMTNISLNFPLLFVFSRKQFRCTNYGPRLLKTWRVKHSSRSKQWKRNFIESCLGWEIFLAPKSIWIKNFLKRTLLHEVHK